MSLLPLGCQTPYCVPHRRGDVLPIRLPHALDANPGQRARDPGGGDCPPEGHGQENGEGGERNKPGVGVRCEGEA